MFFRPFRANIIACSCRGFTPACSLKALSGLILIISSSGPSRRVLCSNMSKIACPFDAAKLGIILVPSKYFRKTIWMVKSLILWQLQCVVQSLWMIFGNLWIKRCQPLDERTRKTSKPAPIFGCSHQKEHKKMDEPARNPSIKSFRVCIVSYAMTARRRSNESASSSSLMRCSRRSLRTWQTDVQPSVCS